MTFKEMRAIQHKPCAKCAHSGERFPRYVSKEALDFTWEYLEWPCGVCGHAIQSNCADAKETE